MAVNPDTRITRFFGDDKHVFTLHEDKSDPLDLLRELERKFDAGIFAIFQWLYNGNAKVDVIREIIRIGLIGGGKSASEAHALVKAYFDREPVAEHIGLAVEILGASLYGDDKEAA